MSLVPSILHLSQKTLLIGMESALRKRGREKLPSAGEGNELQGPTHASQGGEQKDSGVGVTSLAHFQAPVIFGVKTSTVLN